MRGIENLVSALILVLIAIAASGMILAITNSTVSSSMGMPSHIIIHGFKISYDSCHSARITLILYNPSETDKIVSGSITLYNGSPTNVVQGVESEAPVTSIRPGQTVEYQILVYNTNSTCLPVGFIGVWIDVIDSATHARYRDCILEPFIPPQSD